MAKSTIVALLIALGLLATPARAEQQTIWGFFFDPKHSTLQPGDYSASPFSMGPAITLGPSGLSQSLVGCAKMLNLTFIKRSLDFCVLGGAHEAIFLPEIPLGTSYGVAGGIGLIEEPLWTLNFLVGRMWQSNGDLPPTYFGGVVFKPLK